MPEPKNPEAWNTATDRTTIEMFGLLANERRQLALRYLSGTVGAVRLCDLADHIARREGEHTTDHDERVATSLVHTHLPKLSAAGLVHYDPQTDLVCQRTPADHALHVLEVASGGS